MSELSNKDIAKKLNMEIELTNVYAYQLSYFF